MREVRRSLLEPLTPTDVVVVNDPLTGANENCVRTEVEIHVGAVAQEGRARLSIIDWLELELGRKEQRVLLRELVSSAIYMKPETIVLPLDRIERQAPGQD